MDSPRVRWICTALVLFSATLLLSPMDYILTAWLGANRITWFTGLMGHSMFEGKPMGMGDLATLYMIGAALLYIRVVLPGAPSRLAALRPQLGFIVTSSVVTTILMVHGIKWAAGRARPSLVLTEGSQPFSNWYEPGPLNLLQENFSGSFPSGHTATVTIFLTLAYCLAYSFNNNRPLLGRRICSAALALSLLMAVARSMSLSHFITDSLAVIAINWLVMDLLYFHVCRVEEQQAHLALHGHLPLQPRCWELLFCLNSLGMTVGLICLGNGLRALMVGLAYIPALLLAMIGGTLLWFFGQRLAGLLTKVWGEKSWKLDILSAFNNA